MIHYNFSKYLVDINDIIKRWNRRYLTPIGKITIIKTYVLSKFIHLFSTLPNPSIDFLKKLNTIIYTFIWDGKPDKISRNQLSKQTTEGGLKMIDITQFIKCLKISWLRRIVLSDNTTPWNSLISYNIPNINVIFELGVHTAKEILPTIENQFWYDTLLAWIDLVNVYNPKNINDCLSTPIWNNTQIFSSPLYIRNWFKHGIKFIGDLVDENLNILDLDFVIHTYNVNRIDFLTYNRICIGVKNHLKKFKDQIYPNSYIQPNIPFPLSYITKDTKGVKQIYKAITENFNEPYESLKWNRDFDTYIDGNTWKNTFKICFNTISDNYLVWHSYKILTRILGCKYYLNQLKITDDSTCRLCDKEPETLIHLYFLCLETQSIWNKLKHLILSKLNIDITFDKITVLLGYQYHDSWSVAINTILISTRAYIFACANNKSKPSINRVITNIENIYKDQLMVAIMNQKKEKFDKQWVVFKKLF